MSSSSPFQNTGRLKDLPKSGVVSTPELTGKRNSRARRESLVAQIHQSASIQSERVQAIVDGAILAVEQLQDKRIDVLEKGPEVTISDVIFDVLLSLCLMGVGKALVPITESIAKELVQTASYYGGLCGSKIGAGFRFLACVGDQEFAKKFGFGEINPKIMASYHQYCRDVNQECCGKTGTGY